jgi:hypothetical protein
MEAVASRPYIRLAQRAASFTAIGLIAILAFSRLFTVFVNWDDEGYFLQAYRDFLSGRVLYDQVFAVYGPFTFLSAAVAARFDPANVTNDQFRWITLPVWILTAALLGRTVWRATGRFSIALALFLLAGVQLRGLAKSVGHPQLWVNLAGALLAWMGLDWAWQSGKEHRFFWMGALIAVVALTKVNMGVFAAIAAGLGLSLHMKAYRRLLIPHVLIAGAGVLGILLLVESTTHSEKLFALAYLTSLGAIVAAIRAQPTPEAVPPVCATWLAAGCATCFGFGVAATLISGTTVRALIEGVITAPALLTQSYHYPFFDATARKSLLITALALGTMGIAVLRWLGRITMSPAVLGLSKAAIGGTLLCAFYYDHRMALTGSLLFLWLLLVDIPDRSGPGHGRRLLLVLMSALFSIQLFPMAGEQVDWAALLPMTAAALLLADGSNQMAAASSAGEIPHAAGWLVRAAGMLFALFLGASIGRTALQHIEQWRRDSPVNLPGTYWLHLPEMQRSRLTTTVNQLKDNCDTVLTVPGLYSFSLWSGVPPVEQKRFNSWVFLWPEEVQNTALPRLRQTPRGCALVSQELYTFFRNLARLPRDEFITELQQTMSPAMHVQDLTLYRTSGAGTPMPLRDAIAVPAQGGTRH